MKPRQLFSDRSLSELMEQRVGPQAEMVALKEQLPLQFSNGWNTQPGAENEIHDTNLLDAYSHAVVNVVEIGRAHV